MKIEKINDRQIRCVLTKEDLESRKIQLSELVCGGEKARGLLRDMVVRAARELNFSFNNNPLMIEAVPTGKDQLVLIITRVDDPGELKSRFHQLTGFGESGKQDGDQKSGEGASMPSFSSADDILNLLRRFSRQLEELKGASSKQDLDVSDAGAKAGGAPGEGAVPGDGVLPEKRGMPDQGALSENGGAPESGALSEKGGAPESGTLSEKGGAPESGALSETGIGSEKSGVPGNGNAHGRPALAGISAKGAGASGDVDEAMAGGRGLGTLAGGRGLGTMTDGRGLGALAAGRGSGTLGAGADPTRLDAADRSRETIEKELYRYTRFYLFRSLEHVLDASKRVPEGYSGENTLYKNPDDGAFYLLVRKADTNAEQFNRICNVLSEYSMPMDYSSGMDEFFREHMRVIIADSALQHLREV